MKFLPVSIRLSVLACLCVAPNARAQTVLEDFENETDGTALSGATNYPRWSVPSVSPTPETPLISDDAGAHSSSQSILLPAASGSNGASEAQRNHTEWGTETVGWLDFWVSPVVSDANAAYYSIDADGAQVAFIQDGPEITESKLRTGVLADVTDAWRTVNLPQSYTSMIVIATVSYTDSTVLPAVTRIRNATGSSFEVKVQNPSDASITAGYYVHYTVIEEGVYSVAQHGAKLEAIKVISDGTNSKNSWASTSMELIGPTNSYSDPVVLGQVMTANDADWSAFWANSGSATSPPTSSSIYVGKHVGEDSDTTRASETLGIVIIESGAASIEGIPILAGLGANSVSGVIGSPPYNYSVTALASNSNVVLSPATMIGVDGGWPVLYGSMPLTDTTLSMAIDEDQISDSDRSHAAEKVAYWILGAGSRYGRVVAFDGDGQGGGSAFETDATFDLASGLLGASEWTRVTLRQDFSAQTWDLFIDGDLTGNQLPVAINLGFENSVSLPATFYIWGQEFEPSYLDRFQLKINNPIFTDADNDGLEDSWEIAMGLDENDAGDRLADPDSDTYTNLEELLAGSNPMTYDYPFSGSVFYIDCDDGSDSLNGQSIASGIPTSAHGPFLTLSKGISTASDGDMILIYEGAGNYDTATISLGGKDLVLRPVGNAVLR